jgi:hypothetical protein
MMQFDIDQPETEQDVDPDGLLEVTLDEVPGDDSEPLFEYNEEDANLAPAFAGHSVGKASLKEISRQVIEDWDEGYEAREGYIKKMEEVWRLFACELKPKEFPFEHSANPNVPILLENISRMSLRMYGEIFDDWQNVFTVLPIGPEEDLVAQVLTVHGGWQIREQISDFQRQQHRGVLQFLMHGDVTCHSYFDEVTELNSHEMLQPDEFVVPYTYTSTKPDYSDCPWMAKVMNKYRHDIERMRGKWHDVDKVLDGDPPAWTDDPEQRMTETVTRVQGIEPNETEHGAPYKIIWYEGWLQLPNQERMRFCQVIVDYRSRTVLKLAVHERANWQDKIRYDRQMQELATYRAGVAAHQAHVAAFHQQLDQAASQAQGAIEAGIMSHGMQESAMRALEEAAASPLPPPPPPPTWLDAPDDPEALPSPPRKEPIHMFAHGVAIEPLVGNLGLGYGRSQADFQKTANTALAQFTDSATLANVWSWLVSDQVKLDGPLAVSPGKVTRVRNIAPADLKNAIVPLKADPANPQLKEIVEMAYQYGQSSMQAPSVLSGDPGKSGETYRGISARIEQATKQLSVLGRKYLNFLTQTLKNNATLNSMFLPEEEIYEIANHLLGYVEPVRVTREMYARSYALEIRADMRFATQAQRIQEADEIVMMSLKDPMLSQNPRFHFYALKKAFEARGRRDLVTLMGPEPPAGQQPPNPQQQQPHPPQPQQPRPPGPPQPQPGPPPQAQGAR